MIKTGVRKYNFVEAAGVYLFRSYCFISSS